MMRYAVLNCSASARSVEIASNLRDQVKPDVKSRWLVEGRARSHPRRCSMGEDPSFFRGIAFFSAPRAPTR
jgi:hypothetical protein